MLRHFSDGMSGVDSFENMNTSGICASGGVGGRGTKPALEKEEKQGLREQLVAKRSGSKSPDAIWSSSVSIASGWIQGSDLACLSCRSSRNRKEQSLLVYTSYQVANVVPGYLLLMSLEALP